VDKIVPVLLINVPKIEIKITDGSLSGLADGLDILNYCRTGRRNQQPLTEVLKLFTNHRMLLPEPATKHNALSDGVVTCEETNAYVFRGPREANLSASSP
jgi:hypothetical protein